MHATGLRGTCEPKEQGTAVLEWRSPEIRESSGLRLSGWNDVLTSGSGFINPLASSKALTAVSTRSRGFRFLRTASVAVGVPQASLDRVDRNSDLSPDPSFRRT